MDVNVVNWYSHLREKLLYFSYNALGVNLTGTLQVCDGCDRSKAKAHDVRNKTYTRASNPGKRDLVDTTGPFPDILIGNWYWVGVLDNYIHYSWCLFSNTKL